MKYEPVRIKNEAAINRLFIRKDSKRRREYNLVSAITSLTIKDIRKEEKHLNKKKSIMIYNVDYFINKFEAIPEIKWNSFAQYESNMETRCAFGHCATNVSDGEGNGHLTEEGKALIDIFENAGYGAFSNCWITTVNNGLSSKYLQSTPKQRILAALYDIKKMQEVKEQPKEIIRYISVPESLTKITRERITEEPVTN